MPVWGQGLLQEEPHTVAGVTGLPDAGLGGPSHRAVGHWAASLAAPSRGPDTVRRGQSGGDCRESRPEMCSLSSIPQTCLGQAGSACQKSRSPRDSHQAGKGPESTGQIPGRRTEQHLRADRCARPPSTAPRDARSPQKPQRHWSYF